MNRVNHLRWRGQVHQPGRPSTTNQRGFVWQPKSAGSWTDIERLQFWRVVKTSGAQVIGNMEQAVVGLFYPPHGALPVVVYSEATLKDLTASRYTAGDDKLKPYLAGKAAETLRNLLPTESASPESPAVC